MHLLAHRLGVRRDRHDARDHAFVPKHRPHELPAQADGVTRDGLDRLAALLHDGLSKSL